MVTDQGLLVQIRCAWNAWRTAEVPVSDLHDIHWQQPQGAPRPLLHGYVECTEAIRALIPHDCGPAGATHRMLVCVIKRCAAPPAYRELVRLAGARSPVAQATGDPVAIPS
jgi:hypothetical protein